MSDETYYLIYTEAEGAEFKVMQFTVEKYTDLLLNGYFTFDSPSFLGRVVVRPVYTMLVKKELGYDFINGRVR